VRTALVHTDYQLKSVMMFGININIVLSSNPKCTIGSMGLFNLKTLQICLKFFLDKINWNHADSEEICIITSYALIANMS